VKTTEGIMLRLGADPTGMQAGLRKASASVDTFGGRAGAVMGRLNASMKNSADRMLTPMTAALTGGGMALAVSQINDVQLAMVQLGNQAHWSDQKIIDVTSQVYASAKRTGQSVEELITGMSKFVDVTGDGETTVALLDDTATASTGLNAQFSEMAMIAAMLGTNFGVAKDELGGLYERFSAQGDMGAFTPADMAKNGERLFSAAAGGGITKNTLPAFGAMMQVARKTGNSDAATTAIEATFRALKQNAKGIKKVTGFDVFDSKGNLKDTETILKRIVKYTDGSTKKLTKFGFDAEALRFFDKFQQLYKAEGGGFKFFEDLKNAAPDGEKINSVEQKFGNVMKTNKMQIQQAKSAAQELLAMNLAGPIAVVADKLKFLNEHQALATAGFYALVAAATALAAVKLGSWLNDGVAGLRGIISGSQPAGAPGAGSLAGKLAGGVGGVQQVYVTNWNMMGKTDGMTSYVDPTAMERNPLSGLPDEALKTRGALGKMRGGLNKIGGSALGMGLLSMATAMATEKIIEAGTLIYEWWSSKKEARKVNEEAMAAMAPGYKARYGEKAAAFSKNVDDTNLQLLDAENAFLPNLIPGLFSNQKKIDELNKKRAFYMDQMKKEIASNPNSAAAKAIGKNPSTDTPINQEFKIYVDSEKKTSTIEQTSGTQTKGSVNASTIPWSGRSYQ